MSRINKVFIAGILALGMQAAWGGAKESAAPTRLSLKNASLRRTFSVEKGVLRTTEIENKLAKVTTGVSTPTTGWLDDVSTAFAIEWMKQNRTQPFSMVVGFKSPHSPRGGKNLPERLRTLYAGVPVPRAMQGMSWKARDAGQKPAQWRQSFLVEYYRELGGCPTAVGVRTATAKLVKYPGHPEWTEAYDLAADPVTMAKLGAELDAQIKTVNYAVPACADKPRPPAATTRKPQ